MEEKRVLKWIFEAPDDIVTISEFEAWEQKQQSNFTEERSRKLYAHIMERIRQQAH